MVPKVLAEAYNYKASSDCLGALHDIKLRIMITFIQLQSSDRQYNKQVIKFKRYHQYLIYKLLINTHNILQVSKRIWPEANWR